jgi:probable addiction module antidote protein
MTETIEMVAVAPFDSSEFYVDAECQAIALSEALETGHQGLILHTLSQIARARGMTALAKETGIKRETLYAAMGPSSNPTLETLLAIIGALGLHLSAEASNDRRTAADRKVPKAKRLAVAARSKARKKAKVAA